jgi:hypothetical protein
MGLTKQRSRAVRVGELQVRLGEQKAQLAEAVRRRADLEQLLAVCYRFLMAAFGNHRLELDEPGPRVVGIAALIRKEELDRLAKAPRDVLEGGKGRASSSGFDQVDGWGGHAALSHLGQTEAGLHTSLLYSPGPEVDSWLAPTPGAPN